MNSAYRPLLRHDLVRTVERPFGWVPCRMLSNGTITSMSPTERQLYLVLALAADRNGISFHGEQRLQHILGFHQEELRRARAALMSRDLLAYDGTTYQLLPLPPDAMPAVSMQRKASTPSTAASSSIPRPQAAPQRPSSPSGDPGRQGMPESVRDILRNLYGRDSF
jgi:hypothetical protein